MQDFCKNSESEEISMTRIIMNGCNGKMGRVITDIVSKDPNSVIVAGVDVNTAQLSDYPVFARLADVTGIEADVVIDFSTASAVDEMLDACVAGNLPCVLCTTGLSQDTLEHVKKASEKIAILKSANMSLGINLLMKLLKDASPILAQNGFDIEIVEMHHNQKLDAPSGTALALADSVNESLNNEYEYVYDRSSRREKRPEKEIGISAVRGGTITGTHDVIFAGRDEVITFQHMAYSKEIFAKGAVSAAGFLAGKTNGMYDMSDVIEASSR